MRRITQITATMVFNLPNLSLVASDLGQLVKARSSDVSQFIRASPITSGLALGGSVLGGVGALQIVKKFRSRKKTKKKKTRTKKRTTRRRRSPTRRKTRRGKRRIIRGRGLGTHEIRHSGRSTKGKFKVVSFRDKRTGKMVRFKARR